MGFVASHNESMG